MKPTSLRSNRKAGRWPLVSSLVVTALFLNAIPLTWYLWRHADSLSSLQKTLTTAAGWVTTVCAFLGIRHKVKKQPDWPITLQQPPVVLLTVAVSVLVWFFVLPVHSLEIHIAAGDRPLDAATVTLSGETEQSGGASGADGLVRVSGLSAARYAFTVSRRDYHDRKAAFSFTDVLGFTRPFPVLLDHATGILSLSSTPSGADCQIDGVPQGRTPVTTSLGTGRHSIKVQLAGYLEEIKPAVEIEDGKTTPIEATLTRLQRVLPRFPVLIESRARDTEIFIDDKPFGASPLRIELSAGPHRIAAHSGAASQMKTVILPTGNPLTYITFDLEAK